MIRGTTPTIILRTGEDVDLSSVSKAYLTFDQFGTTILDLGIDRLTISDAEHSVSAELTQEETLLFYEADVRIQLRLLLVDGSAMASNIIVTKAKDILKDGVI